jgi:hypothetical protein
MLTILKDVPPNVAGFHATGIVKAEDYTKVAIPEIDRVANLYNKINFLMLLDTDISNYDIGAWIKDIGVGIKHLTKWNKMAIVSDQDWVNKISEVIGYVIPGNVKSFPRAEYEFAKEWVRT